MKIAQNRICISDPPEMCEETSTAYYGDILDVFETSRTADCWDACDVVKECAFVKDSIKDSSSLENGSYSLRKQHWDLRFRANSTRTK